MVETRENRKQWKAILIKETTENIEWLVNISKDQRELLKNYLLNIDRAYRVDPDSERSRNVREGIWQIVNKISQMIAERKPELKGRIIPKGSAHNGTKIGDSDEFDFIYEMDTGNFLNGKGTVKHVRDNTIYVHLLPDAGVLPASTIKPSNVFKEYLSKAHVTDENWSVNTFKIKMVFRKVLNEVLSELELPPGWCHGGFNRPHFSGLRFLGPSHVLQFDCLAASDKLPLRISVDFVPMLKFQSFSHLPKPKPLDECLNAENSLQYGWLSFHDRKYYYGPVEELWLSNFSTQSTSKSLIRMSKVLNRLVKSTAAKYPGHSDVSRIDKYVKDTTAGMGSPCKLQLTVYKRAGFVYVQDDFVSYSDLNETTGEDSILKSYLIKRLVLSMMFADKESQGRDWTDDDLPDLVISIYMLLHESLVGQFSAILERSKTTGLFKEEFSVLLEETHEQIGEGVFHNSNRDGSGILGQGESADILPISHQLKKAQLITKQDEVLELTEVKRQILSEDAFHNSKANSSGLLGQGESAEALPVSHQLKTAPLVTEQHAPKFYQLLKRSELEPDKIGHPANNVCLIAASKAAAILRLLRAVCEGKHSVDIVTLGLKTKKNSSNLAQKREFKELLDAINSPTSPFQKKKLV